MTFLDRVTRAARVLLGSYSGGAGPDDFLKRVWPGGVGPPPVRGTREQLFAYSTTPWVRAIVGKIAQAFGSVEWKLFVARREGRAIRDRSLQRAPYAQRKALMPARIRRGELEEVTAHPFLDEVMDHGNSFHTGVGMRRLSQIYLEITGELFWLKERNRLGVVTGVWPIPPDWVLSRPTPNQRAYRISYRGWQAWIPDTEMLWILDADPLNPYGAGTGMVRAVADELETDEYAAKLTRQFFFNSARPDLIVMPASETESWGQPEVQRMEQTWLAKFQGFWRTLSRPMFASRKFDIYEFEKDFRSLQFAQLRAHERDVILQTWGLPPEMLGIVENSNRATAQAAEYLFSRWILIPRLEFFRAAIQEQFLPEFDERLILDYVSPVEEDQAKTLELAKAAPWALSIDEWRELLNHAPLEVVGAGAQHMVPFSVTPTTLTGNGNGKPTVANAQAAALARAATDDDRRWLLRRWHNEESL